VVRYEAQGLRPKAEGKNEAPVQGEGLRKNEEERSPVQGGRPQKERGPVEELRPAARWNKRLRADVSSGPLRAARQWVTAKIRWTFSSEKNCAGETTPEKTRANPSLASRLPDTAARSCCISGGGGCMEANWQVNS
jgi:hypothetical protein